MTEETSVTWDDLAERRVLKPSTELLPAAAPAAVAPLLLPLLLLDCCCCTRRACGCGGCSWGSRPFRIEAPVLSTLQ